MRKLEFILILILIAVICAMAVFSRWHISVDEWKSEPNNTKIIAEPEPTPSQDIYAELPVTRMEFLVNLGRKLDLEQEYGPVVFTDIHPDSINSRYIYPLQKAGIIYGYLDNTLRPNDMISKNEAEIIVARALKRPIPAWHSNSPYLTKKQMFDLLSELTEERNIIRKW